MKPNPKLQLRRSSRDGWLPLINSLLSLMVLFIIFYALWLTNKGIDFTDEGFYLASISEPRAYVTSFTQFGFFYNIVFSALGGDIVWLRAFNILSVYFLAFFFTTLLLYNFFDFKKYGARSTCVISASLSTSSLLIVSFHGKWLSSPSYNSLALGSLFIIASGVVICLQSNPRFYLAGWLAIAAGSCLLFMAKFSSAAFLTPALFLVLLIAKGGGIRGIATISLTTIFFLCMAAIWIDGSILVFINRIVLSLKLASLQNSGYSPIETLSRLVSIPKSSHLKIVFGSIAGLFVIAWVRDLRRYPFFFPLFFGVFFLLGIFIEIALRGKEYKGAYVQLMLLGALFVGAMLLATTSRYKIISGIDRNRLVLSLFLLFLPYVYAFGTNNEYFFQASSAGIFWILSALLFVSPLLRGEMIQQVFFVSFVVATNAYSIFLVAMSAEHPYRQSLTLRAADKPFKLGNPPSVVFLNSFQDAFLKNVNVALQTASLPPGQPIIDLTGNSPGTLFSLGAKGVGSAWFVGGYPGSKLVIEEVFKHVPCGQLVSSWILADVESKNAIHQSVLSAFGANLEKNYTVVAQWIVPASVRNEHEIIEKLYKPARSPETSIEACESFRLLNTLSLN